MSLSIHELIKAVKQAAVDAVLAMKPMAHYSGEVISSEPLKIRIDQKMILTEAQLILTNAVRDYVVLVSEVKGSSDDVEKKRYIAYNALKTGEKVRLLRCDGGQKFIVFDRVEVPK